MLTVYFPGTQLTIEHTPDARESLLEAEGHCEPACKRAIDALTKRLANSGKLSSKDQFTGEGDRIFAIKTRCGLRAYGWYHSSRRGVFVISHYINKKRPKMLDTDRDRVLRNKRIYDLGDL